MFAQMSNLGTKWSDERRRITRDTRMQRTAERFENGEIVERPVLRRLLTERHGYKCACCGIDSWQGKLITLQVDHVDGDPGNNMPANLRLICPNCHSQCPNWGARNKGSSRKARGLKLY